MSYPRLKLTEVQSERGLNGTNWANITFSDGDPKPRKEFAFYQNETGDGVSASLFSEPSGVTPDRIRYATLWMYPDMLMLEPLVAGAVRMSTMLQTEPESIKKETVLPHSTKKRSMCIPLRPYDVFTIGSTHYEAWPEEDIKSILVNISTDPKKSEWVKRIVFDDTKTMHLRIPKVFDQGDEMDDRQRRFTLSEFEPFELPSLQVTASAERVIDTPRKKSRLQRGFSHPDDDEYPKLKFKVQPSRIEPPKAVERHGDPTASPAKVSEIPNEDTVGVEVKSSLPSPQERQQEKMETLEVDGAAEQIPVPDESNEEINPQAQMDIKSEGARREEVSSSEPDERMSASPAKRRSSAITYSKKRKSAAHDTEAVPQPEENGSPSKKKRKPLQPSTSAKHNVQPSSDSPSKRITTKTSDLPQKVVFSSSGIPKEAKMIRFLKSQSVKVVDSVSNLGPDDCLCVGEGEIRRTSKLTLSVALGRRIVTDAWVQDSFKAGHLLNPEGYLPSDRAHEKQWGFGLKDAVDRGRQGRNNILKGWTIALAPALVKEYGRAAMKELESIASAAGGKVGSASGEKVLVLGTKQDKENMKREVFSKDLLSLSILRGALKLDSEFRI